MADSPHLREISLSLSDPSASQMSCVAERCSELINQSMIANSAQVRSLIVLVAHHGRAVAIEEDGDDTIGAVA